VALARVSTGGAIGKGGLLAETSGGIADSGSIAIVSSTVGAGLLDVGDALALNARLAGASVLVVTCLGVVVDGLADTLAVNSDALKSLASHVNLFSLR
jgi:hypothetical protein